jgi:anti-sigma factor RsiW
LIGYLYGESTPEERRRMEAHLAECDACREEVAGLRRVREDLLAWEVPEHGSVWTPFAPPPPVTWWRQVPAWAMATAAGVMVLAGAAGGAVTHAMMPSASEPAIEVRATPTGLTQADLAMAESRILDRVRLDLGTGALPVPSAVRAATPPQAVDYTEIENRLQRRVESVLAADRAERLDWLSMVNRDFARATGRMDELEKSVNFILSTLQDR